MLLVGEEILNRSIVERPAPLVAQINRCFASGSKSQSFQPFAFLKCGGASGHWWRPRSAWVNPVVPTTGYDKTKIVLSSLRLHRLDQTVDIFWPRDLTWRWALWRITSYRQAIIVIRICEKKHPADRRRRAKGNADPAIRCDV